MTAQRYDWRAVVARLLFSLLVVFSLYNPSGYSFWHWLNAPTGQFWPKAFAAVVLLGLHWLLWRAVVAVLRPYGVAFLVFICAGLFLGLAEAGVLDREDGNTVRMAIMATLVVVMTAGLSFASLMHRLTGVQHVEEVPH